MSFQKSVSVSSKDLTIRSFQLSTKKQIVPSGTCWHTVLWIIKETAVLDRKNEWFVKSMKSSESYRAQ